MSRTRKLLLAVAVLATTGAARPAAADDRGWTSITLDEPRIAADPNPDDSDGRRWYGGPALVADGVAIALLTAAVSSNPSHAFDSWRSSPTVALGIGAYMLGGPINHLLHGHPGRALGSVLLRTSSLAAITMGIALGNGCDNRDWGQSTSGCTIRPLLVILGAGLAITTTALDGSASDKPSMKRREARHKLAPSISVGSNSSLVGLAGTF